jgi:hypothetical protein
VDFFKQNPGIVGQVMRIILEYLGIIEDNAHIDKDDPVRQYAMVVMATIGRAFLMVLIVIVEIKVANYFGF